MCVADHSGVSGSQPPSQDNGLESTHIPKAYARWQEESIALDGHASHLCIRVLRDLLVQRLVAIYRSEAVAKESASAKATPTTASAGTPATSAAGASTTPSAPLQAGGGAVGGDSGTGVGHTIPVAPHPSDQVTPSSHSPREVVGSSVDQLRSSLRQVADALAQTVAAVRTTREQLLGGREQQEGEEEGEGGGRERVDEAMETTRDTAVSLATTTPSTLGNAVSFATPPTAGSTTLANALLVASEGAVPPVTSSPTSPSILARFDGSQESAAVTLASTDPDDPLHTFLSAIVGAPAPPLSSSPAPPPPTQTLASTAVGSTSVTCSSLVSSVSTPPAVVSAATPASVSPRLPVFTQLLQSTSSRSDEADSADTNTTPSLVTAPTSLAPTSQGSTDSSHTSNLAEELARVVSHLVPSSSTSSSSASFNSASLLPPVGVGVRGQGGGGGELGAGQSPSPSDMLAPLLMASLQMPSNGSLQGGQSAEGMVVAPPLPPPPPVPPTSMQASAMELLERERLLVGRHPMHIPSAAAAEATPHSSPSTGSSQNITPMATPSSVGQSTTTTQPQPDPAQTTPTTAAVPTSTTQGETGGATAAAVTTPIDPTFLAALPDSIRQEVMAQHEREQRLRMLRAQRETNFMSSISPEFLAALPPNIQEEVRDRANHYRFSCV